MVRVKSDRRPPTIFKVERDHIFVHVTILSGASKYNHLLIDHNGGMLLPCSYCHTELCDIFQLQRLCVQL
jgi:hypothetical protein